MANKKKHSKSKTSTDKSTTSTSTISSSSSSSDSSTKSKSSNTTKSTISEDRSTSVSKPSSANIINNSKDNSTITSLNTSSSSSLSTSSSSKQSSSKNSSTSSSSSLTTCTPCVSDGHTTKSIGMVPNKFQSSIKFAPCNEKLKEFLITIGSEFYHFFTGDELGFMAIGQESLFGNLSTPQQLNMMTNFIVNYVCFDVNGSVLTRKFVKKLDKECDFNIVFEKEAYLNENGDKLNSFTTLRYIISYLRGRLEMEIDTFGYKDRSKLPKRSTNDVTVEDVDRIGAAFQAKEISAKNKVVKKMEKGITDYSFSDFQYKSNHDHTKQGHKIFNTYFEDIPPERINATEEIRFFFRKLIANAFKGVIPISRFNESLYRCQEMEVWLTVLEMIFNGFVSSFSSELFYFVETDFDPIEKGWMALAQFVDQNTRLFKKIYKPSMYHRDLNKLQYLFFVNDIFDGKDNEKAANFVGSITDYNAQILPKRDLVAYYSICIYVLVMVKNNLNFNSKKERMRGFLETTKYHKANSMRFLNLSEPESVKVSNQIKPVDCDIKCSNCYKALAGSEAKKCSKCKTIYCSLKCQASDWKEHKLTCKALEELMMLSNDELKTFAKSKK